MKLFRLLIIGLFVSISMGSQAQGFTTSKKRAIELYKEALNNMSFFSPNDIEKLLERAVKMDDGFKEAHILRGQNFKRWGKWQEAEASLEKVLGPDPAFFLYGNLVLAEVKIKLGKYEDATEYLEFFINRASKDSGNRVLAEQMLRNAKFAQEAVLNPVPFNPINLGANINSENEEYYPCLTTDDQIMYFTRLLPKDPHFNGTTHEDFFIAKRRDTESAWLPSKNMGYAINSPYNEGAPSVSADGKILFYTACEMFGDKDYGENRSGFGSCDLFYAVNQGGRWSSPVNLGAGVNTQAWETQPSFSSDGRSLYFIRGYRRNTRDIQGIDIWKTTLSSFDCLLQKKTNCFSEPQPLSNVINTPGNEVSVLIHPDGQTLYFSSTGHPGMGGEDLFMSRLDEFGNWTAPVNLGYPINTENDENSLMVTAGGKVAYFASDREGGFGGLDLYEFELPPAVQPVKVSYFKGIVYDKKTNEPLEADFRLVDVKTNREVVRSQSDAVDGSFLVSLPVNRNYALSATKEGYLFFSESFFLENSTDLSKPVERKVPLTPIEKGEKVVLKNVFFESGMYDLKSESFAELDKLVTFLTNNNTLSIEIGGHTDNVGSDEDNLQLSDQRAEVVRNYLVEKGISASRLSWKGYGETVPVQSNDTPEGRALNRRTEFMVVE